MHFRYSLIYLVTQISLDYSKNRTKGELRIPFIWQERCDNKLIGNIQFSIGTFLKRADEIAYPFR